MKNRSCFLRNLCWIVLLAAGVFCVWYGVAREEWDIVLNKAIMICYQCIGLG